LWQNAQAAEYGGQPGNRLNAVGGHVPQQSVGGTLKSEACPASTEDPRQGIAMRECPVNEVKRD